MVHFAVEANGAVRPLCGDWGGDPNWTKIPTAVSCPGCHPRLVRDRIDASRDAREAGDGDPGGPLAR